MVVRQGEVGGLYAFLQHASSIIQVSKRGGPPGHPGQGFLPPVRSQYPKTSRQKTPPEKASQKPESPQSKAVSLNVAAGSGPQLDDVDGYLYHSDALFQFDLQIIRFVTGSLPTRERTGAGSGWSECRGL
jgi:hypothetical protein